MTINLLSDGQTLAEWMKQYGSLEHSRNLGGVVPAYPVFMFLGIIVVIIASLIQMKRKHIPLNELYYAILITIPAGILGGSIFGKIWKVNVAPSYIPWYHIFFFWEPGMSLFGALAFGIVGGFAWFYRRSKVTKISVWVYADVIIVNILLGQSIGRWGNFYNHEIMGSAAVSYDSLNWLIPSIRNQMFSIDDILAKLVDVKLPQQWDQILADKLQSGSTIDEAVGALKLSRDSGDIVKGVLNGELTYHAPLFLYESLTDFGLWILITFVLSNASRFFQKKAKYPWDLKPKAYPGWFNKKYKSLSINEIESWACQRPIKYKKLDNGKYVISFWEAWNKAYYLYEPSNQNELEKLVHNQFDRSDKQEELYQELRSSKDKHKSNLYRLREKFERQTANLIVDSENYKIVEKLYRDQVKEENLKYKNNKKRIEELRGGKFKNFRSNPDGKELEKINNPNGFFIIRCGVITGAYVFGYTLVRMILEAFRKESELFVQNSWVADYIVLSLILLSGVAIILIAQLVAPYKYREAGWLYEKSY